MKHFVQKSWTRTRRLFRLVFKIIRQATFIAPSHFLVSTFFTATVSVNSSQAAHLICCLFSLYFFYFLYIKPEQTTPPNNDQLPKVTTILGFYDINLPLNNDLLSTTATNFGFRGGWSLHTGLIVYQKLFRISLIGLSNYVPSVSEIRTS